MARNSSATIREVDMLSDKDIKLTRLLRYGTLVRENFEYDRPIYTTPTRWLGFAFVGTIILGVLVVVW